MLGVRRVRKEEKGAPLWTARPFEKAGPCAVPVRGTAGAVTGTGGFTARARRSLRRGMSESSATPAVVILERHVRRRSKAVVENLQRAVQHVAAPREIGGRRLLRLGDRSHSPQTGSATQIAQPLGPVSSLMKHGLGSPGLRQTR